MSNELQLEAIGQALIVRFMRPGIRNPLSVSVLVQLHKIVDNCSDNSDCEALIITGADGVFASGANLNEIAAVTPETARGFAERGQNLMKKITELPQTTIAAVNGFCFGGALDLVLACDKRIASPDARFAHPGAGLGIITGWGGTQRLPRLVGQARALEIFFTAEAVDAGTALSIGLIDEITSDPVGRAIEVFAARLDELQSK